MPTLFCSRIRFHISTAHPATFIFKWIVICITGLLKCIYLVLVQADQLRANWIGTVKKDLRKMTLTWEETELAAPDRSEWHRSVAQCIHLDAG